MNDMDSAARRGVQLEGGPCDGRLVAATTSAVTLLLHDVEPPGSLAAYRRTRRATVGGLVIFSWTGTAPPAPSQPSPPAPTPAPPRSGCDPNYAGACIPPYPPDLDRNQIPGRNFRVVGTDVDHFDVDHDGIACEE